MPKFIDEFLKKYIEKNYAMWGVKLEADLPPEFIITDHAYERMSRRFNCRMDKMTKVMLKAWRSDDKPDKAFMYRARHMYEKGIYKMFNGYVFVFRIRYNKKLGFSQKYLVTVFKKAGYQFNH